MVDLRVLSLLSKVSILVDMFDYSLSFLAIVGAFAKALIPLDADGEAKKMNDAGRTLKGSPSRVTTRIHE